MAPDRDLSALLHTTCERKQARRARKRLKSACRTAHAKHKKVEIVLKEEFDAEQKRRKKKEKRKRQRERKRAETTTEKQRKRKREGQEEEGDEEEDMVDPFEDETYTVERFKAEAAQMRQQRMLGELGEDDREIQRLEAKLKKGKKKKMKEKDEGEGEEDMLERAIWED